jgi:hypothetical protein
MEDLNQKIIELMDLFDGEVTTADQIDRPQQALDREAYSDFMKRNPMAGGGMLVQPSADGSRPGYAVSKTDNNKYRVTNERGGKTYSEWARENDIPLRFSNKRDAQKADKQFKKSVPTKGSITKEAWTNEMTSLTEKFNKMVLNDFEKGDMSKTPKFTTWLKNQKLKNAGVKFFQTQAPSFGVINVGNKKFELADILINRANNSLKHTEWMDIQKKVSSGEVIDTNTWRSYIDRLDTKPDKANKAFNYLLDNDIELKLPKNLSKTMAAEGSLLRKVISDITGLKSTKAIRTGLNMNDAYNKNIDQIKFANKGNLWTQGEGRTLSEILENADYRMKGNISWTSDIKLSSRANKNVFDYALRNFNYHQLNKTGEGTIQFYDKKTNKPIDWNTLPKNKNGFRTLKPSSVYFIDANDPNRTKWDMTSIDADNLKWSKGTGSSGLFDEVFQAKDIYDNLLSKDIIDPRTGTKTNFGKLMQDVYRIGFSNFGNPYAIEHKDGVAENPFKNLKIASQRINSALSALNRDTKLNKFTKDQLFKILKEGTFDPNQKNVIDTIIKGTAPIREDVLVQGTKFDQSELDMAKQKVLTNLDKNKFRRVSKVLVDAAVDGGFGEAVQKICMRKKAKKGGRMFLSNGSGCPAADQDPKGFLRSVSENPVLKKFFTSNPGQKAATAAARVTGNVLNPSTLIGGEVAFVLADGFNNFSKGMDLAESFDRAFIFKDFKQFDKNIMEQAKNLGYDQNQLNLLNETMNINRLDNRKRALEYGLNNETPGSEDLTMGFTQRLADTKNQLDKSVSNYIGSLDKMGFDLMKDSSYDVGFRYLDNVFKKRTQDQMLKTYDKRKRQVDPTSGTLGNILDPILDVGAYTQPFKFAADVVNPFTKNVPLLSDRQREAKYLREMDPRELYLYNKQRGFTLDDIEAGTSPQIRQVMDQLGGATTGQGFFQQFKKGGRAGFKTGSVRKGVLSLIDDSVKKTPKDITSDLTELIKKTLDEDFFDKKDRIVDTLNVKAARERKNFPYNQKVQEEPDQLEFYDDITKSNFRTKTGPFFDRRKRAGGGILKQAGDRSGPPPESGPNPQGLQGLLKRGMKI